MKNVLYFDHQLNLRLLTNEEADDNSIWIAIETDAFANQTLEVVVNGATTSYSLESSTATETQIPDSLWATGGDTTFRLTNASYTAEYQKITFPEVLTTDAALYEVSDGAYKLQGQTAGDASAYATQVVAYTNARGYEITTRQIRVISVDFTVSNEDTTGVFNCTILLTASDITDEALCTARIMYNRVMDEIFVPVQTLKNGQHIITIHYPLTTILALSNNNLSVYLSIDDGQIDIQQGAIWASVLAAGLTASEWQWDGRIDIDESWTNVHITNMTFDENAVTDGVVMNIQVPIGGTFIERYQNVNIPSMTAASVTDNVSITFENV